MFKPKSVCIITGGCGEISREFIKRQITNDNDCLFVAIDLPEKEPLLTDWKRGENFGEQLLFLGVDLSDKFLLESVVGFFRELRLPISGLVHTASLVGTSDLEGWSGTLEQQNYEMFERAYRIGVSSIFFLIKELKSLMEVGNCSVVNIGSIYGVNPPDWRLYEGTEITNPVGYGTSKAALLQLTRYMATLLAPRIRVNYVVLGGVERSQNTSFQRSYVSKVPMGRMATESDCASVIKFLLSIDSSYITGQQLIVDGGFTSTLEFLGDKSGN